MSSYGCSNTQVLHPPVEPSQFGSWAFTKRAKDSGLLASMGSIGDCYDCEKNQGLPGRGLTLAYDWPWCLGVDLSAPARWRSTHTPAGREGGDRIGA